AVSSMENGGYVYGYPDGYFRGGNAITRAEFATMLVQFFGTNNATCNFSDVKATHWAYKYIATASSYGWVVGYEDGTFRPDQAITRAEAVTIINHILERGVCAESELGDFTNFDDNTNAGAWYYYEIIEAANDHLYEGHAPNENWTANEIPGYYYDVNKYERP
ncbi:MAG: S-layer homology domain-containing protein, partial [Firmicutes bacterium]|nr:S-layer homology domain-containing protein [Bacillota bacterium]